MLPKRQIPDDKESSTNKMLLKFYESVACPLTRRGEAVFKGARDGMVVGGLLILGPLAALLSQAGTLLKAANIRASETCNYERDKADLFNCTFDLAGHSPYSCRNTGLPGTPRDAYFPLNCFNNTNMLALVLEASGYADEITINWFKAKSLEVLLWTPVLGIGVATAVGGLYGFFKTLAPEEKQQEELKQSLVENPSENRQKL